MAAAKVLRELGGRNNRSTNLAWLRLRPLVSNTSGRQWDDRSFLDRLPEMDGASKHIQNAASHHPVLFPSIPGAGDSTLHRLLRDSFLSVTLPGVRAISQAGWQSPMPASGHPFLTFTRIAHSNSKTPSAGQSSDTDPERPEEKSKTGHKGLGSRIRTLLSGLEEVPVGALGLGLAGAIPFVGLTPGIASLLPLPVALSSIHIDAQAAYGAVILTFLGGPHWGLAMTDYGRSPTSRLSRQSIQTVRYIWSVVPSLVAWPALLLSPVPKLALLITAFGLVLGVDAAFAKMGLVPSWYMPLRVLLTGIAMLSLTSSLLVSAAAKVIIQ